MIHIKLFTYLQNLYINLTYLIIICLLLETLIQLIKSNLFNYIYKQHQLINYVLIQTNLIILIKIIDDVNHPIMYFDFLIIY